MAQITATELATELGTDSRTVRKFLRATVPTDEHPGKGARWAVEGNKRAVTKMRKQFDEWSADSKPAPADVIDESEESTAEVEEPTDEAIAELETEDDELALDD